MSLNLAERVKHLDYEVGKASLIVLLRQTEDYLKANCSDCGTYGCDVCYMTKYYDLYRNIVTPKEDSL